MEIEAACSHDFDHLDDATAALILQLQDRDIEEHLRARKGKVRDDQLSDADLAMEIYQQELKERHAILNDRCMSRSITEAVMTDAPLLKDSLSEEDTAIRDRALAHQLAGDSGPSEAIEEIAAKHALEDGVMARLGALYVWGRTPKNDGEKPLDNEEPAEAESLSCAASRAKSAGLAYRQCTSCLTTTPLSDIFQAPCGDHYCLECLQTLFEMSTTDENLFPPRCCRQRIPLSSARLYLNPKLIHTFEQKSLEFRTSDRTYCFHPRCSKFIAAMNIAGEQATCEACGSRTCTICKNKAHNGDCPRDTGLQQVLNTAQEQGWQRCYSCRRVVELEVGCNHMQYALLSNLLSEIH